MRIQWIPAAALGVLLGAQPAWADFSGQPILGPLGPGSVVNGDTTGKSDDNDGFSSGGHFFDLWHGGDDVWQLDWPGGPMSLEMTYDPFFGDLDLFLFEPGSLDDSANYSIQNDGDEHIDLPSAPAGTYYINVDGAGTDEGPYTLAVTPEPGTLGLMVLAVAVAARTRRTA